MVLKKLKICMITSIFPPDIGGPSPHVYELSKRLSKRGHEIHVVTYGHTKKHENKDGFTIHRTLHPKYPKIIAFPLRLFLQYRLIKRLSKKQNFDLIYVFDINMAGIPAVFANKGNKIPMLLRFSGDYVWEAASRIGWTKDTMEVFYDEKMNIKCLLLKGYQAYMLKKFKHILFPSDFFRGLTEKNYSLKGMNTYIFQNPTSFSDNIIKKQEHSKIKIIAASRIIKLKGLNYLLYGISKLEDKNKEKIQLDIYGGGTEKNNLINLSKKIKISKFVKFKGTITNRSLKRKMAESDIYILPSISEVFPNTVIEAMSCKLPVVATNSGGTKEIVKPHFGILVPPKNSEKLSEAISILLDDNEKIKRMGIEGHKYAKNKFDWDTSIGSLINIFKEILK